MCYDPGSTCLKIIKVKTPVSSFSNTSWTNKGCLTGPLRENSLELIELSSPPCTTLGTGHKVTSRVGRSDLGWAMENLWAVSMG